MSALTTLQQLQCHMYLGASKGTWGVGWGTEAFRRVLKPCSPLCNPLQKLTPNCNWSPLLVFDRSVTTVLDPKLCPEWDAL